MFNFAAVPIGKIGKIFEDISIGKIFVYNQIHGNQMCNQNHVTYFSCHGQNLTSARYWRDSKLNGVLVKPVTVEHPWRSKWVKTVTVQSVTYLKWDLKIKYFGKTSDFARAVVGRCCDSGKRYLLTPKENCPSGMTVVAVLIRDRVYMFQMSRPDSF